MKTLKLNHDLALLVLKGKKTSTWRLYDDKDLSVDDDIELIDKVKPENRNTWRPIGIAHINQIIQKRLSDISEADAEGQGGFSSPGELVKEFQAYYGSQVTLATPIKIIHFSFSPATNKSALNDDKNTTQLREIMLFADGGSRGNPGPSASGFALLDMDQNILVKRGIYLGVTTNNQAEYQALKLGLEEAAKMRIEVVHVHMDSLLVVNQMLGVFKVRNRELWPIHDAILRLTSRFKKVTYVQVPREFNKIADAAVNEALDAAAVSQAPLINK